MNQNRMRPLAAAVLIAVLTAVCNLPSGVTPTPTPLPGDVLIPPTTKVMDAEVRAALQSVSADETVLTFSASTAVLAALEPGDVLVSEATAAAPHGLLRKVVAVRTEGSTVIVEAADAELIEAVHRGHVAFTQELRPEDIRTTWLYPGVTMVQRAARGPGKPGPLQLLPDEAPRTSLLEYSIDTDFGTGGRVKAAGTAKLAPILEADVGIGCNETLFGVCAEIPDLNFMTRLGIDEEVSLSVKGDVSSFNKKVEIARHEFATLTFWMGPVPVVFVPILSVYLQGDGSLSGKLDYSIGQRLTLAAGLRYNSDSGWEDLSEASFDFLRPSPSFDGQVDLRGALGGEFKLLLYGAIGPFGSLEAGPRLQASLTGLTADPGRLWKAEGCIWLFVGIDSVKVIKLRYQKELYKACALFADGQNQPPVVSIQSPNQGTQIYQGESVPLRATAVDVDGGQVTCSWTSTGSGDPFPITQCEPGKVTFSAAGSRTLTLTGTDPTGASASASVSINVLPPPTILVSIDSPLDGGTVGPDEVITLTSSASGGEGPYNFSWSFAFPTDAAGNGGSQYAIATGNNLSWAPSHSVTFAGCEVNAYGRLSVRAEDSNGFSGDRSIVTAIMRIC